MLWNDHVRNGKMKPTKPEGRKEGREESTKEGRTAGIAESERRGFCGRSDRHVFLGTQRLHKKYMRLYIIFYVKKKIKITCKDRIFWTNPYF